MAEIKRPELRDCPFCHTKGSDEESIFFTEHHVVYDGGSYPSSYSIMCSGCGVELHDEYQDEVVRLWNGVRKSECDEADDG